MADTPEIAKAADRFKRALLRQNDAALREMSRVYGETWKRLKPQADRVTKLIGQAEAAGKQAVARAAGSGVALGEHEYSINWLSRQARYHELMYQTELEIMRYSRAAAAMVGHQQTVALDRGREDAEELMRRSLGPVPKGLQGRVSVTWNRVPDSALQSLVGVLQDGSPLEYKFAVLAPATAQGIKDTLAAGLAQGWNPRRIAAAVKREYHGALGNALVTCRTEVMRAYRGAAAETYRANADIVTGWIWTSAQGPRTCAACWGRDGSVHGVEETLVDHPNGRCVATVVTRSYDEILNRPGAQPTVLEPIDPTDAFRKLSVADQQRVLGPGRYRLWQDGKIKLRDLAQKVRSQVWGDHYQPKSIKALVKQGKITAAEAKAARGPGPGVATEAWIAERRAALKIPPAWQNVQLSPDPNAHLQATGVDAKGRKQYRYSAAFAEGNAAAKFERVKAFDNYIPRLDTALTRDIASDDTARAVYAVRRTGFRPGGEGETRAKVKAYGISTLEARHVSVAGDRISFNFIGKKGVHITRDMEDADLAAMLSRQLQGKRSEEKLFVTSARKMNAYLDKVTAPEFKIKDLRTWNANNEAERLVNEEKPPATHSAFARARLRIATAVSKNLGNTPAMALKAYIMPQVWRTWESALAGVAK